jgi:hypothetical protein
MNLDNNKVKSEQTDIILSIKPIKINKMFINNRQKWGKKIKFNDEKN